MKHLLIFVLSSCLFSPVPAQVRPSEPAGEVQFWDLPTGSRIAYYFFRGREPRNPFPIIYLHGGPGGFVTSHDVAVFSQLAGDGYDVYLYDQVGGGRSERLENIREYSIKRHLHDLEAIIDMTGAPGVIFIGHSWGASLAPLYLAEHPGKVEKLIFSGPGGMIPKNFKPFVPLPDSIKLKNRDTAKYSGSKYLDAAGWKRLNRITNYAGLGIRIAPDKEVDSLVDCMMMNRSEQRAKQTKLNVNLPFEGGSGGYSHIVTGMSIDKGKDNRKILTSLNIPVMILLGESDNLAWGCVADYLHVFKNIKLVIIPDSDHAVFSYQPDLCLKLTREFLNSPVK
jgi:proline iminopeptidase